jgi:RNA polymerase primary sigma factor
MGKKFINNYDTSVLSNYFKDIKNSKPLTSDEEVDLAIRIQNGDLDAVNKLVTANLKFVISIAKDYQNQGIPLSDLINEGNIGLIRAAYKFDPERKFRFISYAVWWVRQSILQFINDNSRLIRLPTNVINKISSIKKELNQYELKNGYTAITDLGLEGDCIHSEIEAYNNNICTSLNNKINPFGDDDDNEFTDIIGYEEEEDYYEVTEHLKEELGKALSGLDERERDIIECYFGINRNTEAMTLEGIGDKYGITKERVRQVKERAIKKLRHNAYNLYKVLNE